MIHAFFLAMGGFALDMSHDPERVWPTDFNRMTITAEGYNFLLGEGYSKLLPRIPEIPAETIKDKSKASGLAKMIVCGQAIWFCVQLVARLSEGLPISLLELNTSAHTICALLIYIFWWEKPLDIDEPVLIPTTGSEHFRKLCADIWSFSPKLTEYARKDFRGKTYTEYFARPYFASRTERSSFHFKLETWMHGSNFGRDPIMRICSTERPHITALSPHRGPCSTRQCGDSWPRMRVIEKQGASPRNHFADRDPPVPPFRGLHQNNDRFLFTSYDPPVLYLKAGDQIPGTPYFVTSSWQSIELTESMLARLQCINSEWTALRTTSEWTLLRHVEESGGTIMYPKPHEVPLVSFSNLPGTTVLPAKSMSPTS